MKYFCCKENRKDLIRGHGVLNGIDYLEVIDNPEDPDEFRQTILHLYFIKELTVPVTSNNIRINIGEQDASIPVIEVNPLPSWPSSPPASPPEPMTRIEVKLAKAGNFSIYTLCLVALEDENKVMPGMDKLLSCVDFSFKVACNTHTDCKEHEPTCIPEDGKSIMVNYLARDYASFKQLMLDRMALLTPQWQERNAADLGIAMVELLAYAADYLSYSQDAIATEAYLQTARKRNSVRRHARLVDYHMHEGNNARAWVRIEIGAGSDGFTLKKYFVNPVSSDAIRDPLTTKFITGGREIPLLMKHDDKHFAESLQSGAQIFELMYGLTLFSAHNEMNFYTYGDTNCCLPKGATEATLLGYYPNLKVGDVVLLVEVLGPETGNKADADPGHRHAVRIVEIKEEQDVNFQVLQSPPSSPPQPMIDITVIKWNEEDALPFPLCISKSTQEGLQQLENISMVYGNIALVDHGMTQTDIIKEDDLFENLQGTIQPALVPAATKYYADLNDTFCSETKGLAVLARYNPGVTTSPITYTEQVNSPWAADSILDVDPAISASALRSQEVKQARPHIRLFEITTNPEQLSDMADWTIKDTWLPKKDLLIDSESGSHHFVVEVDEKKKCHIRFGDDINGKRPNSGSKFIGQYRTGNGAVGNVGALAIAHMVSEVNLDLKSITNPLPAFGGQEAESLEEVKQYAPEAFRTQERAVTREDYENFSKLCTPDIQRATASFRWTGSWHTAFVSVDRLEDKPVDKLYENQLRGCLEKYRMAGMDLEVDAPVQIGLEVEMEVCIAPEYFQSDIRRELLNLFSNRTFGTGKSGMFHPDKFSFGQPVHLSKLYATAQSVEGVTLVEVLTFRRLENSAVSGLKSGILEFNKKEIPRLDNDPNFRDRGIFNLIIKGGR